MRREIYALVPTALLWFGMAAAAPTALVPRTTLLFDGIPRANVQLAERLHAYLAARQARLLDWSPAGQLLIATRFGNVDELHLVAAAGGERRQLTFGSEPVRDAWFSPDPWQEAFVFSRDSGGNGQYQLYYQSLKSPLAHRLTDGNADNGAVVWSNSGHEFAFLSAAPGGGGESIAVLAPRSGAAARVVVAGDGAFWVPLDWSPDDRRLLVSKAVAPGEAHLYVVDLDSGKQQELEPHAPNGAIGAARFSRDGQGVYMISDRDSEFRQLRYVNLFTGESRVVAAAAAADVREFALSRDGHYLAYVLDQGGSDRLATVDLRAQRDLPAAPLPSPVLIDSLRFDADGKRLALCFSAADRPRDAYVLDLADNRLTAWTRSEAGGVDVKKFVGARLTHYPTFDSVDGRPREIPVYLFEPASPGPHPVLIVFHGGPDAAFRPVFDPWIQYVVNELGFAVVAPNLRGSTGYGKGFAALDDGRLREDAVKDIGTLLVWLQQQSDLDAKRVVVSGRSYGGYLALAALANYSDRLRGGVDMAGMTDLIGYLDAAPPYRQAWRRAEFGDERVADMRLFLRDISPLASADRIGKPVLIVHGENDPQVPVAQAQEMVDLLRSHKTRVWFLRAADEGHEFTRLSDLEAYYTAFAQFLSSVR